MFKEKKCRDCGNLFQPTAPANILCLSCSEIRKAEQKERKRQRAYERWAAKQRELGRDYAIGVGKGNTQKHGKGNSNYSNGIYEFIKFKKSLKGKRIYCERCGADLTDVSQYYRCVHHKDGDRTNNSADNFEVLCKRCHQVHHKCWLAFEGATTIP